MLEGSLVVLPANMDTVGKLLRDGVCCGKSLSPYLVKSLEPYAPEKQYLEYFGLEAGANFTFTKGKGCDICAGTGYIGRLGIFEVLAFDDNIRHLITDGASTAMLQEYVEKAGLKTLKQDALEKVNAGLTTLEEVVRAV